MYVLARPIDRYWPQPMIARILYCIMIRNENDFVTYRIICEIDYIETIDDNRLIKFAVDFEPYCVRINIGSY